MRNFLLTSAIALGVVAGAHAQQNDFYLHNGDHVLFYGDSITDQRNYTMMIETYVVTRYPGLKVRFTNSGWGGDRVTGGGGGDIDLRLRRDVIPYHPSVITIMLGMNDGGYKAATEASDKAYFDGYRHIVETLKKELPQARITAIEPSPYDDVTRPPAFPVAGGIAYNNVMTAYGRWVGNYASENHLTLADANTDFVHVLQRANTDDPGTAKDILADHIHPSFGGSLLIGEAVLKSWNARPVVASVAVRVDGAKAKIEHAEHTKLEALESANGSIRWEETDDALPLPFVQWEQMWGGGATVGLVIRDSDITQALNQEPLRVVGLRNGVYSVRVDGASIGTFSNDQLATGINLALLKTPMTDQAMRVYQLTTQHGDIHYDRWRHVQVPLGTTPAATAALTSLDALEDAVVEQQYAAATPTQHTFEVVPEQ
ncbi:MAG TPA: SGNH/GDSL hydrolase family protein [Edaphobacter sp.]|nr:SGNH/GDSL hydrolase family protein [Edaphobacter sp.]